MPCKVLCSNFGDSLLHIRLPVVNSIEGSDTLSSSSVICSGVFTRPRPEQQSMHSARTTTQILHAKYGTKACVLMWPHDRSAEVVLLRQKVSWVCQSIKPCCMCLDHTLHVSHINNCSMPTCVTSVAGFVAGFTAAAWRS